MTRVQKLINRCKKRERVPGHKIPDYRNPSRVVLRRAITRHKFLVCALLRNALKQ